ncbi:MAG: coenzyme F420-0:L-glutamate ligase [Nocardioides sp.]|uniref:coenzyme F420-0:L-glutamate ligase n=1 Tax=Nocardioides sp. TaxID=35761 RepID=UPI0039E438B2
MTGRSGGRLEVLAPDGVGEVRAGDDLAELLLRALAGAGWQLSAGDIVVVTSKVVAKAEGRVRRGTREDELSGETVRVVARRGHTAIVRNRLGLTMAAAGIDASNVPAGHVVLLPEDPDSSARELCARLRARTGVRIGVVVTDTAGRAWRDGQTDLAIGAAGVQVLESFAGRQDPHGNSLVVTAPAVADELASTAELAQGKLGARPFAVVRGRADLVLSDDGPGAARLIRAEGSDFFGYGAREAVVRALAGEPDDRAPFGAAATADDLCHAIGVVLGRSARVDEDERRIEVGIADEAERTRLAVLAFAHGWSCRRPDPGTIAVLQPLTP